MARQLIPFRPGNRGPGTGNGQPRAAGTLVTLPGQRRRSMLALGLVLAGLGALAGAWVFTSFSHRVTVLAITRSIPAGTRITAAELTTEAVSVSGGVKTIPARQQAQVTGEVTAVGLVAGTLLAPADLTSALVPGPGQQLVPVALKTSQLPASGLSPGERVMVIATPGAAGQAGSGQSGQAPLTGQVAATVYQVSPPDNAGEVVVDVLVAAADGPPVAEQDSTGQIALIVTKGT
ncbi:MAG TPA: SAF domain-containing protein [Streptosporangiaceae bacterium]|jgi:hypothetical protein